MTNTIITDQPDELVPDPQVAREFAISLMGLWRWDHDEALIALGWPAPAIKIRRRKYRLRKRLETFKANLQRQALGSRPRREGRNARHRGS